MILELGVDWHWGYGNSPDFKVLRSVAPDHRGKPLWEVRDHCWRAEEDGVVWYLSHDGREKNAGGYSGAHFNIMMKDGTPRTLRGPWSGNAAWCNFHFPDRNPCVEAKYLTDREGWLRGYTFTTGNATETAILQAWRKAGGHALQTREHDYGKKGEQYTGPVRLGWCKAPWRECASLDALLPNGKHKCDGVEVLREASLIP